MKITVWKLNMFLRWFGLLLVVRSGDDWATQLILHWRTEKLRRRFGGVLVGDKGYEPKPVYVER